MKGLGELAFEMRAKTASARPHEDVRSIIDELSQSARRQGSVTLSQLSKIALIKSPRRRAKIALNGDNTVRAVTALAFSQTDERVRIGLLRSLHGVEIPTASAILAWVRPDKWGVIDRRAWTFLLQRQLVRGCGDGTGLGPKQWEEYHAVITALAHELGWQPQKVDTWLFHEYKPK